MQIAVVESCRSQISLGIRRGGGFSDRGTPHATATRWGGTVSASAFLSRKPTSPLSMNRVALYIFGTLMVVSALAYVGVMMAIAMEWIIVGSLILLGLGVMAAASKAKGTAKTNVIVDERE